MTKVYLAGGFYADNWQGKVRTTLFPEINTNKVFFFDPKEKERNLSGDKSSLFKEPKAYTFWDINAINKSDIIFIYIDKGNPALGTLVELGYAKGKGKTVILVVESNHEIHKDRYFDFGKALADVNFPSLEDGINFLKTLL